MELPKHFQELTDDGIVPSRFNPDEAYAWACGYNAALEKTAAPELLDKLNKLYNAIDSCIDLTPELLNECKNAIKKATE